MALVVVQPPYVKPHLLHHLATHRLFKALPHLDKAGDEGKATVAPRIPGEQQPVLVPHAHDDCGVDAGVNDISAGRAGKLATVGHMSQLTATTPAKAVETVPAKELVSRDARKGKPARRGPPKDGKRLEAKALRRGKKVVLHEEERVPIDSEQVAAKEVPHRHVPVTHAWQHEVARSPPHERLPLAICKRIGQGIWLDRPVPVVKAVVPDVLDHLEPLPHLRTRPSPRPTAAPSLQHLLVDALEGGIHLMPGKVVALVGGDDSPVRPDRLLEVDEPP